jgi:hypothetical protein
MSDTMTSAWAPNALLYGTTSGQGLIQTQQNALNVQKTQQDVGMADMSVVGRAAASLLNMPEDQAAAAYGPLKQSLQAQGFGKNLPDQYPGHATAQAFVQRALTVPEQYQYGLISAPGGLQDLQDIYSGRGKTGTAGAPAVPAQGGTAAPGGGTAVPGGGAYPAPGGSYGAGGPNQAQVPAEYLPFYQEASQRTGIPMDVLIAQHRQESGFNPNARGRAGEIGIGQIMPSTALAPGYGMQPIDPATLTDPRTNINFSADYLKARLRGNPADPEVIRRGLVSYNGGGDPNYVANVTRYLPAQAGDGGGTAVATTRPVIIGDSLASPQGLGGSGTVGAQPGAVLTEINNGVRAGTYRGQPVVLSSGISNAPDPNAALATAEQQLQSLKGSGASGVTVVGVGPAIEARAPGTNAKLAALAQQNGATFVPLPANQMGPDGVHPTPQGYAALKTAIAPPPAAPGGGVAARTGGTNVAGPGAGPAPPSPPAVPAPTIDLTGPRPLPPTGPGSSVATPASLANTPLMVPRNALAPPASSPAMPTTPAATPAPTPVPAPPPAPAPAASPAAPALPHMADVPVGMARPQVQQAQDLLSRAMQIEQRAAQAPMDQRLQATAKSMVENLRQQAQVLMSTDNVVQTQEGQLHTLTGAVDKPVPNFVFDPVHHAWVDTKGTVAPIPEQPYRADAVAQRDVMELGPKVANGTATPQEQAAYATAVETYRQPTLRENPVTKETVRVNTRELPAGFPEPPGLGSSAAPAGQGGGPSAPGGPNVVIPGYSIAQQQIERDPAAYKVSETQYTNDAQEVRPLAEAGRQAQADQVRLHEMQDVLQRFSTGPGTEWRTAASSFLQRWLPSAVTGWEKQSADLSGSDAAQAFSKLALVGAGTQERGVLGPRGGYQAIKLFKDANPNVDLNDATNKSILDMQLITNQANQDYTQAALSHFADNEKKFSTTHQYDSLNQFDRNWNAQRNPQVYSGAMGAISGQPFAQWSKGLQEPEIQRALDIVSRANPSATVNGRSGRISMQPQGGQGALAPVSVATPADAQALPPGTPYVTPDGRKFTR